jgi:hypothetical protein
MSRTPGGVVEGSLSLRKLLIRFTHPCTHTFDRAACSDWGEFVVSEISES